MGTWPFPGMKVGYVWEMLPCDSAGPHDKHYLTPKRDLHAATINHGNT